MQGSQPSINGELQASERPVSKQGVHEERTILEADLWLLHIFVYADMYTHVYLPTHEHTCTQSRVVFPFDLVLIY